MNPPAINSLAPQVQHSSVPATRETASTAVSAKATAMVRSRYEMALRQPRNEDQCRQNILHECKRPGFAQNKSTLYNKPIGKGVEGLGIRFVEAALRHWKNVLVETDMIYEDDEKEIWHVTVTDLEANATWPLDIRCGKTVERSKPMEDGSYLSVRQNSYGKPVYTVPAGDDDLLNKRAALISKAIRNLGLRIIPGDIQDEAEAIIRQIREDDAARDPDAERKKIADAFAAIGVKVDMLTEYLGHDLGTCSPTELADLRGIYGAIKDGEATWAGVMDNLRQQSAERRQAGAQAEGAKTVSEINASVRAAKSAKAQAPEVKPKADDRPPLELGGSAPSYFSFAEVMDAIVKAANTDELDLAVDMIRNVADPAHKVELDAAVSRRRAELKSA